MPIICADWQPVRTLWLSARSPNKHPIESIRIDFPAPVSPVIMVKP